VKIEIPNARVVRIGLTGARKANDNIPEDEMLLAEAIAAAKAHRLGFGVNYPFTTKNGSKSNAQNCDKVCALGALHFAGVIDMTRRRGSPLPELKNIVEGNDPGASVPWDKTKRDRGSSLGWAFRCAMEEP
jgi:hypothetical protein